MRSLANQWAGGYFESYSFLSSLNDSIQYFETKLLDVEDVDILTSYSVEKGEWWIRQTQADLAYYVKDASSERVFERKGECLEQIVNGEIEISSEVVTSSYQYVIEIQFNEQGAPIIQKLYGANIEQSRDKLLAYGASSEEQLKGTTMVFAVSKEIENDGYLIRQLQGHLEDGYILAIFLYLAVGAILGMLVAFFVPFAWFEELALVRGLLFVPLELRFLFVIGTFFAMLGAPILVISKEFGYFIPGQMNQGVMTIIHLICWCGYVGVIWLHFLYIKEFFMIGPWQMIRRHTILGQLIGLFRRPKEVIKVKVEEKVVLQEDPRVDVMTSQLARFKETLNEMRLQLETVESVNEVIEQLDMIIKICNLNQPKQLVNMTSLVTDTLDTFKEQLSLLEVKRRFPTETVTLSVQLDSMKVLLESLIEVIASQSLPDSRVYLELIEEEQRVMLVTRSVLKEEVDVKLLIALEALVKHQSGTFESLIDGDLMRLTLTFRK
ncbi:MAG: hypothetical protein K2G70_03780 [Turicibacter sp.]|nr:hypothetical protein [Turicibacter sp.]